MTRKIAVWGDSILKGVIYDAHLQKYRIAKANSLAEPLGKNADFAIYNFARFGLTAPKALHMLESRMPEEEHFDVAFIELGGNDCDYNWEEVSKDPYKEHYPNTELSVYKQAVEAMIKRFIDRNIEPVILTLPPIDPYKYFAWITQNGLSSSAILKFLGHIRKIYTHQERYNLALMEVAAKHRLEIINLREIFLMQNNYTDFLCLDGIHVNEEGHLLMRQAITRFMQTLN